MADNMCNVARALKKAITYWFTSFPDEVHDLYLLIEYIFMYIYDVQQHGVKKNTLGCTVAPSFWSKRLIVADN